MIHADIPISLSASHGHVRLGKAHPCTRAASNAPANCPDRTRLRRPCGVLVPLSLTRVFFL